MGTTASVFYVHKSASSTWDGTSPTGGDIRKLLDVAPTDNLIPRTECTFGTGSGTIVVDPYTTRSTLGTTDQDKFGWAVNVDGSDGMEGTASALRRIPAGVWNFVAHLRPVGGINTVATFTVRAVVYRISADGTTRTELFTSNEPTAQGLSDPAVAFSFASASQPEFTFEDNETVLVSYRVIKTATSALAENAQFMTGHDTLGVTPTNLCTVTVPSPGVRTKYLETITATAVCTPTITDGTKLVSGIVYDHTGTPVSGATVKLFNQTTDAKISERASGANGSYTFTRTDIDTGTYYTVGFSDSTHHGTSDRDLTAT